MEKSHLHHKNLLNLETPATYRIRIKGDLEKSLSDCLSDMKVTTPCEKGKSQVTVLTGRIRDQTELNGILNNLNIMGKQILSVELLSIE